MTKIVKATSKGQITLPVSWRKKFNTDQFILTYKKNTINIQPLMIDEIIKEKSPGREDIIFDADRDNKGIGIEADEILSILRKIDKYIINDKINI